MNGEKICTFWYHKYPKMLLPWVSQTIEQAGLSLVLFLSLKEAKSTHGFAYSVQSKQVQRGHLATAEVTDPGFWALPKRRPWLSDLQQKKCHQTTEGNQLNSDTASPSIKPQSYSLPFSLVQTQIHCTAVVAEKWKGKLPVPVTSSWWESSQCWQSCSAYRSPVITSTCCV